MTPVVDYIPSDPDWLQRCTILLVRAGSHAYGTSTPTSDLDLRGIAIPPSVYWLGFSKVFDQRISREPSDLCIYGLRKYFDLAADCNPNILELLWTEGEDVLLSTPLADRLRDHRDLFLSQKARHTYSGYAMSQLKRIKTHRRWLLTPPTSQPTKADFDLPERRPISKEQQGAALANIQQYIDSWELDLSQLDPPQRIHLLEQMSRVIGEQTETEQFVRAGRLLGFDDNMLDYLERIKRYSAAQKEWEQYQHWIAARNPARAELEAKFSFDTKHATHLVRLMRQGREVLEGKGVIVRRPDAEELREIRAGAWSYEKLLEFAEREDAALTELVKTSTLPKSSPREKLDDLCHELAGLSFFS